jgi:hypothetical protein
MELKTNSKLITPGYRSTQLDPTTKEAITLNNMAVDFMKDLERNPQRAKQTFKEIILPHMMRAIHTVKLIDEQLEASDFQVHALLKANVIMIDMLKKHSIDLPNFTEILADANKERSSLQG